MCVGAEDKGFRKKDSFKSDRGLPTLCKKKSTEKKKKKINNVKNKIKTGTSSLSCPLSKNQETQTPTQNQSEFFDNKFKPMLSERDYDKPSTSKEHGGNVLERKERVCFHGKSSSVPSEDKKIGDEKMTTIGPSFNVISKSKKREKWFNFEQEKIRRIIPDFKFPRHRICSKKFNSSDSSSADVLRVCKRKSPSSSMESQFKVSHFFFFSAFCVIHFITLRRGREG